MWNRMIGVVVAVVIHASVSCAESPAATQRAEDAAELYQQAVEQIHAISPAESNLEYNDYPPFPPAWHVKSKEAWEQNGKMFELARRARAMKTAKWPEGAAFAINPLRRVAHELADGVLHEHLQGHDAAAVEIARDELHLARLLAAKPTNLLRLLVSSGIVASATNRLQVIGSGIALTNDEADKQALNARAARELINELLDQRDPKQQLVEIYGPEGNDAWTDASWHPEPTIETLNRANAERTYAAMSLSCHLFHLENGHWPQSLANLVPKYLPRAPIDPWGDGKQTFGYALIKNGLPDGSHRPVVYSRCNSAGDLFYRLDGPQYGYYGSYTTDQKTGHRQRGGQFHDVARWLPVTRPPGSPDAKRFEQ